MGHSLLLRPEPTFSFETFVGVTSFDASTSTSQQNLKMRFENCSRFRPKILDFEKRERRTFLKREKSPKNRIKVN